MRKFLGLLLAVVWMIPVTARAASGVITCYGNGTDGPRVQMVYVVGSTDTDRFTTLLATGHFTTDAQFVDAWVSNSGVASGGDRHIKFLTNNGLPACQLTVGHVVVPEANINAPAGYVSSAGFNRTDRKYILEVDHTTPQCFTGIGSDSTRSVNNLNNHGPGYSTVGLQCWGASGEIHEFGHLMGAVQNDAPHASGAFHCYEGQDVMCYNDGGPYFQAGGQIVVNCPPTYSTYDCNFDDYWNAGNPPVGTYLWNHWNTADSSFLIGARPLPTCSSPPPASTVVSGNDTFNALVRTITTFYNADCGFVYLNVTSLTATGLISAMSITMYKADGSVCATASVSKAPTTLLCDLPVKGQNLKVVMSTTAAISENIKWNVLANAFT